MVEETVAVVMVGEIEIEDKSSVSKNYTINTCLLGYNIPSIFKGNFMKKILLTLLLALSTFLQASDEAPSFSLTTIDDKNITINQLNFSETETGLEFKEFKGKAILLTLWGHRCPPCMKEIPEFISLTKKHKDDLEIVAIEAQGYPADKVKEFATNHQMNYNVVVGADYNNFINYIASMAGYSRGIPLPLLIGINKKGEVEHLQAGLIREDELEMLVKELND